MGFGSHPNLGHPLIIALLPRNTRTRMVPRTPRPALSVIFLLSSLSRLREHRTDTMSFDFSKIPAQAPPAGVTSNFENPYSLAVLPRGFIYATLPPMLVFLGLRFYTRIKITRNVGVDDCEFVFEV